MINNYLKKTATGLIVLVGVFLLKVAQDDQTYALKAMPSETCTDWAGTGIQFRQCETDWGGHSHQFYNGYSFQVHFFYYLEYVNGTNSGDGDNEYIDGNKAGDKTANDGPKSVQNVVKTWRITKKEKKDASGRWVQF
jgi:hypothetical protein